MRITSALFQWRNSGPAAAGSPGKKGFKRGPLSRRVRWGLGPIFEILRGGPKFEVTPLLRSMKFSKNAQIATYKANSLLFGESLHVTLIFLK